MFDIGHNDVHSALGDKVTETGPPNHEALHQLGLTQIQAGDYVGAVASLQAALAVNPESSESANSLSLAEARLARERAQ